METILAPRTTTTATMQTPVETRTIAAAACVPQPNRDTAAAALWLNNAEIEGLMALCLTTAGESATNDAILGKLATAWRRLRRTP